MVRLFFVYLCRPDRWSGELMRRCGSPIDDWAYIDARGGCIFFIKRKGNVVCGTLSDVIRFRAADSPAGDLPP